MRLKIKTPTREFEVTVGDGKSSVVVGNRASDDVTIDDDPEVSGPHVRIEMFAGVWSFTDQFSRHGTFLNGEKKYSGDLTAGDVLRVGSTTISIHVADEGSALSAAPARSHEPPQDDYEDAVDSDEQVAEAPPPEPLPAASAGPELPDAFVRRITERLVIECQRDCGADVRNDATAMARIAEAARNAVIELKAAREIEVNLPFLTADATGPKHLNVQLHRRHLHERVADIAPGPQDRNSRPARKGRSKAAKSGRPGGNQRWAGVGVVIGVVAVGFMIAGIEWFSTPSASDGQPDEPTAVSKEDRKAEEQRLIAQAQALMQAEDRPPTELLDELDRVEETARQADFRIGWDYERARTHLQSRVYRNATLRYNDTAGKLHDLRRAHRYREAQAEVDSLWQFLSSSPHNQRAIDVMKMDREVQRWKDRNVLESERYVFESLLMIQEARSRNDFGPAAEALGGVTDGAILDEAVIEACRRLQQELKDSIAGAEVSKPFERRDRPPRAPENALLPNGDLTGHAHLNALQRRVLKEVRDGLWEGRRFEAWGLAGAIYSVEKSSQMWIAFTLALGGETELGARNKVQLSNLPPRVRLAVLMVAEDLTLEGLTGLLIYAFDNGLSREAEEIAYRIRQAGPEMSDALDEVLSAKWGAPIPEGGFPERDGRVVTE